MKRPNLLLLHTDQQRFDALAASGNSAICTPNLDRLAANGVNFKTCIAQSPVCMPSRVSLLSGQYPGALGITQMAVTVPPDTLTLPKILRRYGYDNALIGKLHFLPHANRDHRRLHPDYDFDHMELSDEPGCYEDAYRAWVRRKDPQSLDAISLGLPPAAKTWQDTMQIDDGITHPTREVERAYAFRGPDHLTHAAFVGEQTCEYLQARAESKRPFFCFAGFYGPHEPFVAPQAYLDLYSKEDMPLPAYPPQLAAARQDKRFSDAAIRQATRGYYAMVSEVDAWIGKILTTLAKTGQEKDTIIAFTSDHGEFLGEHQRYGKGFWAPDVISRVPLILSVPAKHGGFRGRQETAIVESVDVVPTLLALAAIPIDPLIQGSVLPVAKALDAPEEPRDGLTEYLGFRSLRLPDWRYVISQDGKELLFDLKQDPWEYESLALDPQHADRLADCRKRLLLKMLKIERGRARDYVY